MHNIQPIRRESASLRESVTAKLREAILNGHLKPGQKLIERELCSSLDISRTLLRESLPLLSAEGLTRSVAHKGTYVALVDADEVRDIYQIRRVLEALAAREFTRNASDQQIRELRQQLNRFKSPQTGGNLRDLLVAQASFYAVLFEGCGNKLISQILTQLNNRMILYKRLSLSVTGRLSEVIDELEAFVSAVEARNPQQAGELCELHVINAERTLLRQLSDEPDFPPETIGSHA
jgi:DNA-binding GntR family transcriptional regulator